MEKAEEKSYRLIAIIQCRECLGAREKIDRNTGYAGSDEAEQTKRLANAGFLDIATRSRQQVLDKLAELGYTDALEVCKECRFTSALVANRLRVYEDKCPKRL